MYILIEADAPFSYKMVKYEIDEAAIRKVEEDTWELIGICPSGNEQKIATFIREDDAYKALQELFEVITSGGESWDAVEFKKGVEKPPF